MFNFRTIIIVAVVVTLNDACDVTVFYDLDDALDE